MSDLPPPAAVPGPALRRRWHPAVKWVIAGGATAVLVIGGALAGEDDDDGGRKLTLTEAACETLQDGYDAQFTYELMKDLADDHSYIYGEDSSLVARVAVDRAVAQGCR